MLLNRRKKLCLNIFSSVIFQITTFSCCFILPRLFINYYGSLSNGLIASISNFLAFFALMEFGMGAVVRASLFKPLANNDFFEVSRILASSRRFYFKVAIFSIVYTIVLVFIFPFVINSKFDFITTSVLIVAIAFNSIAQYLFGVVNEQLLAADQKDYVRLNISSFSLILSTVVSVLLIKVNTPIYMVKICAAIVFLVRPFALWLYVKKKYKVDFSITYSGEPIKQKWNGIAQHIAIYVMKHSGVVVLSLFSSLLSVSIYYVYSLVTSGLQSIVEMLSNSFTALFGNMFANNEIENLKKVFASFEFATHFLVSIFFSCAFVLIIPFVRIYILPVVDVNYLQPNFAFIFVLASMFFCLRTPYLIMILSIGHFKQTQNSAVYEVVINVFLSVILVRFFDLSGVAMGMFIAVFYRLIYFVFYLSKNVLYLKKSKFLKYLIIELLLLLICTSVHRNLDVEIENYGSFFSYGAIVFLENVFLASFLFALFAKKEFFAMFKIKSLKKN